MRRPIRVRPWPERVVGEDVMPPPRAVPSPRSSRRQQSACARRRLAALRRRARRGDGRRGRRVACAPRCSAPTATILATALPLRFLGAVHRLVLDGPRPGLAAHYPSAGGTPGAGPGRRLPGHGGRAPVGDRGPAWATACRPTRSGRSAVLAPGYAEVARRRRACPCGCWRSGPAPGSTCAGTATGTTPAATTIRRPRQPGALRGCLAGRRRRGFPASGRSTWPSGRAATATPSTSAPRTGRTTLRAYLWPDQVERRARLEAAFAVAEAGCRPRSTRADLGEWAAARLAEPVPGVATVVVHSIVWQYVPRASRDRLRTALQDGGRRGRRPTPRSPGCGWSRPARWPTCA